MKKIQKITSFLLSLILIFVPVTIKGQEETSPQKVYEDGNKVVYRTIKEVEGKINHWEVVYDYKIKPTKNIYILIDRSKEMQRGDYFNKTKTGAKNLAKKILEDKESFNQVTVITYNKGRYNKLPAQVEIGPSRNLAKIESSINAISLDNYNKTNHQAGYHEARKLINEYKVDKNYIVNLTNKASRQSYEFATYKDSSKYDSKGNSRIDLEAEDMNYTKYADNDLVSQYYKPITLELDFVFKNHALSELNMIKKDGKTRFYSVGIEPTDFPILGDILLGGEKDFFEALASSKEDYYESENDNTPSIEESMDKIGDSIKADSIKATDLLTRSISDKFIKEVELEGGGNEINLNFIDNLEGSQDKEGFYNGTRSYKISLKSNLNNYSYTNGSLDRTFNISSSSNLYYSDEEVHKLADIATSPLQYDVFARFYTYDENGKMYFIKGSPPIKIVKNKKDRDIRVANIIDNIETDKDISHQPNFVDDYDEGQVTYETSPVNDLFSDQLLLYRRELNHDVYNKEVGQTGTDKLVFNLENSEMSSTGSGNKKDFRDYFVVLNRLVKPIELRVKTIWLDRDGKLIENRQAKNIINLFKNGNKLERDLATENDDYLIIGDLPYYDEEGKNIQYSVTSPYQEGFIQVVNDLEKYEPSEITTKDYKDSYDLNVVMREAKFDLPIEARWLNSKDEDLTDKIDEEIRVNIYRTVADERSLFQSLDLNKANGYKASLKDLDIYNPQGKVYTYEVVEEDETNLIRYENNIITKEGFAPVDTALIYNRLPKTSIDVEKIWEVNNQDLIKPIDIRLFRKGLEEEPKTLNLNSENNWKGTFDNLDKYDQEGELIEYAIQEVAIEGTYATITKTSEKGYTIVNKEKILPMTGGAGNKFLYTTGILSLISLFLVLGIKRRTRMGDIDD